jgi:hypothetical protein
MEDITISDQVLIGTTLFLGVIAMLTPWLGEGIKAWWAKPKLKIGFSATPPACHRTRLVVGWSPAQLSGHDAFYFRFDVTNEGRSQARKSEAVLEELWIADAAGNLQQYERLTPVTLPWGSAQGDFVNINPSRRFYCDFLTLPDREAQEILSATGNYVNPPDAADFPIGIVICTKAAFFSQPNRLPPGRYRLTVAIYSENADTVRASFDVAWSGTWKHDERDIHRECVVTLVPSQPGVMALAARYSSALISK